MTSFLVECYTVSDVYECDSFIVWTFGKKLSLSNLGLYDDDRSVSNFDSTFRVLGNFNGLIKATYQWYWAGALESGLRWLYKYFNYDV